MTDAERLIMIMRAMNDKTFGLRFSEKIVGGRARLERLIVEGRIRADKGKQGSAERKMALQCLGCVV